MFEVVCHDEHGNVIHSLTQWDMNQTLRISWSMSEVPVIHFCNRKSEESLTVQCTKNGNNLVAQVPNILLQEPYPIIGYIYLYGSNQDSRTIYAFEIPVRKRVKPNDYIYEDDADYISVVALESRVRSLASALSEHQSLLEDAKTEMASYTDTSIANFQTAANMTYEQKGTCLPLSGGTMTGAVDSAAGSQTTRDNYYKLFRSTKSGIGFSGYVGMESEEDGMVWGVITSTGEIDRSKPLMFLDKTSITLFGTSRCFANPTGQYDVVNKKYVDDMVGNINAALEALL